MEIIKRNGTPQPFDARKIRNAIRKANATVSALEALTDEQMDKITDYVTKACEGYERAVGVEEIQDIVEKQLMAMGAYDVAKNYIIYRKKRERARDTIRIRGAVKDESDITDQSLLLVNSMTQNQVTQWDREKIARRLVNSLGLKYDDASDIAKDVESQIIASNLKYVSSGLIRELVNNALIERGYKGQLQDLTMYKVPRDYVEGLMHTKSTENSNIVMNNPEAVNLAIAELVLKQWALDAVYTPDIKKAHDTGAIHVHDLGYPTRVYCSSHSIEYIKKYGLKGLNNLNTVSKPAKSASVLTGHLNTFLASMQANYAGALGLGYINILYAPYLMGMDDVQIKQVAQELIFNGSQNAFSRGGQSLHPDELIWVKADGKYRSVPIGEFVDGLIENNPDSIAVEGQYEIFGTTGLDLEAVSFTKARGRQEDKHIQYVARMPHKGKMYRIHTSNGIVNVTGDHSLFAFQGAGEIVPTKAKELKQNDFVVIPHKFNVPAPQDEVNTLEYMDHSQLAVYDSSKVLNAIKNSGKSATATLREHGATRYIMKDAVKTNKVRLELAKQFIDVCQSEIMMKGDSQAHMPAIMPLTHELGYVAGMYCAEGFNSHKRVLITNMDEALLAKVEVNLDALGYEWHRRNEPQRHEDGRQKVCGAVDISGILGYFLQCSCSENNKKIVPSWVIDANDACVDGFLEGFYDGENSNRTNPRQQNWSVSNTSRKVVAGISLLLLRQGRESLIYETKHPNNPTWNTCYEIRESGRRKVNPFSQFTTTTSFEQYKKHMNAKVRSDVQWMIDSDLSVSIIKKIEEYDYEGYVYDISVPETEAFLGGTGNVFFKNTLFLDFNIHTGVPDYLKDVPAIGPGGKYMFVPAGKPREEWVALEERDIVLSDGSHDWGLMYPMTQSEAYCVLQEHDGKQQYKATELGRVLTYGDFTEEAMRFTSALLQVWKEGDAYGHVFEFPKCDFHVSAETFTDPAQKKVFDEACDLASHNGSTYFVFDRDSVSLASCCRLRVQITDMSLLKHPERLRTCGFQNITINIPQCAYRAKRSGHGDMDGLLREVDSMMELCVKCHLQKRASISKMMAGPGEPLWQLGKLANDGRPYLNLDDAVYIIGMIGVNDAVQFLTGEQLHESEAAMDMGIKIIAHMFMKAKEYTEKYKMVFKLEESPAESAARRLAKADLMYYRDEALGVYKGGSEDNAYYTNSIHLAADAPVSLVERITKQSMYHSAIESGAIIHAFIGEEKPDPKAIGELVRNVLLRTQAAQLTFSPEFTYCLECGRGQRGLHDTCDQCGSSNVVGETRVVGYFSKLSGWNRSKRYGELVARHHGQYAVCTVDDEGAKADD